MSCLLGDDFSQLLLAHLFPCCAASCFKFYWLNVLCTMVVMFGLCLFLLGALLVYLFICLSKKAVVFGLHKCTLLYKATMVRLSEEG